MNRKSSNGKKILVLLNVVIIVGLGVSTTLLYLKNRDLNEQVTLTTEEKNKRLVSEINKVYKLPDDEPVVAIVTDPEEFKKQYTSFTDAKSGDYLLFFRKSRLNVLYRQSEKRVVMTANVVVPIAVEIVGNADVVEPIAKKLRDKFGTQVGITKTINASVTQSFIYDVDNDQNEEAVSISKELKLDVGTTLPTTITPVAQTEVIIAVSGGTAAVEKTE